MTRLSDLQVGQGGCVEAVAGDAALTQRLMAMGLLPGTAVTVVRVAPLGDPITIELHGSQLSIRRREAAEVTIAES